MDNANYHPPMLLDVVGSGALESDPFVLVDVGCGLGLDAAWRLFGADLHAYGFDPQIAEIERLANEEENPHVHYHAALVGLPDEPPPPPDDPYFNPFERTSAAAAVARSTVSGSASYLETNDWRSQELSTEKVGLAAFLREAAVDTVDFVKTDTDGGDLEVLRSFEDMIRSARVLGFMVETPFTGSPAEGVHTFHSLDRLLKRYGFLLYTLSVNRYSRAALPAPFQYELFGSTVSGQAMWGDLVYLRDAVHADDARFGDLSPQKLLKLACVYELFQLPDCAAETLLVHRKRLSPLVDVDRLLDLLTPPLDGRPVSYREYVAAFEEDPTRFYPPAEEPESAGEASRPEDESTPRPLRAATLSVAGHLRSRLGLRQAGDDAESRTR